MTLCWIGRCGRERSLESHRPVPRVLGPWRTRRGVARQQARGDQRVMPAREQGLGRERRRLTDAPPVRATSAVPSTLGWVTPTRQRLVAAARPEVPARVAADRKDVDGLAHRVAHLRARVAWADGRPQDLGPLLASPDRQRTRVEAALAWAQRVLDDRDDADTGAQGWRVVDPQARWGPHGASGDGARRESRLEAASARLTALHLRPGQGDEARQTQALLAAAARAQGPDARVRPRGLDSGGGAGRRDRSRRAPDGDPGAPCPPHRRDVGRDPVSMGGVSAARTGPGPAAPAAHGLGLVQGHPRGGSSRQASHTDLGGLWPLDGTGRLAERSLAAGA